jgi:hypothetical protein
LITEEVRADGGGGVGEGVVQGVVLDSASQGANFSESHSQEEGVLYRKEKFRVKISRRAFLMLAR